MNSAEYWIWIQNALGIKARLDEVLGYFKSPKDFYDAGVNEWRLSGAFTAKQISSLQAVQLSESGQVIENCRKNGIDIITPDDRCYPKLLLSLPDLPAVLYVRGSLESINDRIVISIVGTRQAARHSLKIASALSNALSKAGAVIVSGGALGVDTAAHSGALSAGGMTVAVLGCGLCCNYLKDNEALRAEIAKSGAVITEYPPDHNADRTTFPIRNRIISGMSMGTVVIEAGEKSGSLITARLALSQGRDVFAVPGDVVSSAFTGTNRLIRDGARPVFCAMDILEEYSYLYPYTLDLSEADKALSADVYIPYNNTETKKTGTNAAKSEEAVQNTGEEQQVFQKRQMEDHLSEHAKTVYALFGPESVLINDLAEKCEIPLNGILSALTELEINGYIALTNGRKYIII